MTCGGLLLSLHLIFVPSPGLVIESTSGSVGHSVERRHPASGAGPSHLIIAGDRSFALSAKERREHPEAE